MYICGMKRSIALLAAGIVCLGISAAKPKVVAHRGHWTAPGAAQNSIAALQKADSIGCYASEFDVWMTADSVLVVNHDPKTPAGVQIESSAASEVLDCRLSNGEQLPTLQQYLEAARRLPRLHLVLEIKEHDSRAHEREAVRRAVDMVNRMGLADRTTYITFSRDAVVDLVKLAPKGMVQYLSGDYQPEQVAFTGCGAIDYNLSKLKRNPGWIDDSHSRGLLVNVWTVNKESDLQWCIDRGVDLITTNDPELLQRMLK